MKKILIICIYIVLMSCSSNKFSSNENVLTEVFIEKIESLPNHHIIYGKSLNNKIGYKIISRKDNNINKYELLKINQVYKFKLVWISEPSIENRIGNYLDLQRCITRYPSEKICTEAGYELYSSENLIGLKYKQV